MLEETAIDSRSTGDPARFQPFDLLEQRLKVLPPAPANTGRVVLLVSRRDGGRRETPERVRLTPDSGMPGDAWGRRPPLNPEGQLTVMQANVAEMFGNGQPLCLSGDNLVLDLDLSSENLPVGTRLRAGGVTLEVTPKPHNGCAKFRARYGDDALRLASQPELRHLNLRGIYMRVVEGGEIAVGDAVEVLSRSASTAGE